MSSNPIPRKWTFDEYVAYEQDTGIKHEFIDGEIYAMTGGTRKHSVIGANCIRVIGNQILNSGCSVTTSDMRVQITVSKYVYPDFLVFCGKGDFTTGNETTLKNPTLVAEVISESSEKYDTGMKSEMYRSLPSVQHYLIIHQNRQFVQLYTRDNYAWRLTEYRHDDHIVNLHAVEVNLPLSEIYRGIDFDEV